MRKEVKIPRLGKIERKLDHKKVVKYNNALKHNNVREALKLLSKYD